MIYYIAKNKTDQLIGLSPSIEEAKMFENVDRIVKVDLNDLTAQQLVSLIELLELTPATAAEAILQAALTAQNANVTHWIPTRDYGDGEYVIYQGRRVYATGRGNRP